MVVSSGSAALFLALWALNARGKDVAIRSVCRQNLLDTKWPELRETLAHQVVL